MSFSHPVGSTVTGIISVTGSDATQSLVSGGFLFDAGFNLLSGLASQLAIYMASVIMGTLTLKNVFYAHTHD